MKIAQISDLHLSDKLSFHFEVDSKKNLIKIFENISKRQTDMIIFTGDLGHPKEYFFIKELIREFILHLII